MLPFAVAFARGALPAPASHLAAGRGGCAVDLVRVFRGRGPGETPVSAETGFPLVQKGFPLDWPLTADVLRDTISGRIRSAMEFRRSTS